MNAKLQRNSWVFPVLLSIALFILIVSAQGFSQSHLIGKRESLLPQNRLNSVPMTQRTSGQVPLNLNPTPGVALPNASVVTPPIPAGGHFLQDHVVFERNEGQADGQVIYLSHGSGYSLFLTRDGATIVLPPSERKVPGTAPRRARYFRLRFGGANPGTQVAGIEALPGTSNYFSGSDPKLWHTRIPQFAKVRYSNLYPGIDLIFYFRDGQLEYDVVASPGANLEAVNLQVEGANPSLTRQGDVSIKMGGNELVRLRKPYAYQRGIPSTVVPASYSLYHHKLSFALGDYDNSQPLVIDPALIFATFITSDCATCQDAVADMAADDSGVYLTGSTGAMSFPTAANGTPPNALAYSRTFIVKLDPSGQNLIYSAFLDSSAGAAIAVDHAGATYVSGSAYVLPNAGIPAFPLTVGVFSRVIPATPGTLPVAYAAKLSPDGATILYSTLLQQPRPDGIPQSDPQVDTPSKIAVDSSGALYIAGTAANSALVPTETSAFMPVPVTLGAFQTSPGTQFVLKLNPTASGLDYATYFDGPRSAFTSVAGIKVDTNGNAYIGGTTTGNTFPTTAGAYQQSSPTASGYSEGYVMKLNPGGSAPVFATYFGSAGNTVLSGFALDPTGQPVISGYIEGTLPITPNAFCGNTTPPGTSQLGYVLKFTGDGAGIVYATSLCTGESSTASIAVDTTGAAYAVGVIGSPANFQPILLHPVQGYIPPNPLGPLSALTYIAVKLDTSGTLQWSTFLGSDVDEQDPATGQIAVDSAANVYFIGRATSIPPTPGSFGPASLAPGVGGSQTFNFLLKIAPSLGAPVPLANQNQLTFAAQNVGTPSAALGVQVGNFGDAPMSPVVTVTGDFSETNTCSVAVPGGQECDISVVFTPTAAGPRTGTLTLSYGGNIPSQMISLTGAGAAPSVTLSPASLSFGMEPNGTSTDAQQVTVLNSGSGSLVVSSVVTSSEFSATNTCGAPIAAGSACTIQVIFTPSASGSQSGTLTITDNAPGSPQTVALTGNQPATITVAAVAGSPTSATVTAGQTATYDLSVGGTNGFSGTVNFTCSGAPAKSSCSVTPNPANVTAKTPSAVTVSVITQASGALAPRRLDWRIPLAPDVRLITAIGIALLLLLGISTARLVGRSRNTYAYAFVVACLIAVCIGCGGGSTGTPPPPTGTPPPSTGTQSGQYTLTLTASSGSISQTMNLSLTVK